MKTAAMSWPRLRSSLGFLTVGALSLVGSSCSGGGLSSYDGGPPPAFCRLPFDPGPCRAIVEVYAAIGGACLPQIYGGCEGNENRFSTLEECMAVCEGRPLPRGCPAGRIAREICLGCGAPLGCANAATVCARPCDAPTACPPELPRCEGGVCQAEICEGAP